MVELRCIGVGYRGLRKSRQYGTGLYHRLGLHVLDGTVSRRLGNMGSGTRLFDRPVNFWLMVHDITI